MTAVIFSSTAHLRLKGQNGYLFPWRCFFSRRTCLKNIKEANFLHCSWKHIAGKGVTFILSLSGFGMLKISH